MYALPGQDVPAARLDLAGALELQPAHVSHYQLTIEPGTVFAARRPPLPDEDAAAAMLDACAALLGEAGFAQYEVSAYARPGRQCRHNLNYWRFGDYLGVGAGAHGKLTRLPEAPPRPTPSPAKGNGAEGFSVHRRWKLRAPRGYIEHAA